MRDAGETLIAAANEAGGRDNITVVLFRLEDTSTPGDPAPGNQADPETEEQSALSAPPVLADAPSTAPTTPATSANAFPSEVALSAPVDRPAPPVSSATALVPPPAPVRPRSPRMPHGAGEQGRARKGRRARRAVPAVITLVVLGLLAAGAYLALGSVYFIGTNGRGLVTLYRGVPYQLPGGIELYSSDYVTGVSASTLSPVRRRTLLDHSLRSEGDASSLLHSLERGQLGE